VIVDASLHTPGGAPYGQPVPIRVTITEYGTVALYITVAAAAVLFLMAGLRLLRRVLAARRRHPPDPATVALDTPADGSDVTTEQPEQPEQPVQPEHERLP
jgi:hypothetical protein